jgi:hypothetical protein
MKTQVTTVCDLEKELPPDAPDAPKWLVKALQVPREEGFIESQGCDVHYFPMGQPREPPFDIDARFPSACPMHGVHRPVSGRELPRCCL